jgi:hypothetical protein
MPLASCRRRSFADMAKPIPPSGVPDYSAGHFDLKLWCEPFSHQISGSGRSTIPAGSGAFGLRMPITSVSRKPDAARSFIFRLVSAIGAEDVFVDFDEGRCFHPPVIE